MEDNITPRMNFEVGFWLVGVLELDQQRDG